MRHRPLGLSAFAFALFATAAAAQTSVAGSPGGTVGGLGGQLLSEGFFGPTSGAGGVGSGAVGSPVNTRPASTLGLFGAGGLWATARPVQTPPNNSGVRLVDSPNGTASGSAPATTTTSTKPGLGGVGARRFLGL